MTTESVARAVLGDSSVHGVEDVRRHLWVSYTPEQRRAFEVIPFGEETLRACAGTHLLVAGFPLSLVDVRGKIPQFFWHRKPAWYDRETEAYWAQLPVELRWHLIRKEPVPDSSKKLYIEQRALLSLAEEVPRAGEVVYAMILHFLGTGQRLFENAWVRCRDQVSSSCRVVVGSFDAGGLCIHDWRDERIGCLGLAFARKFLP
jgi:hypothetical protein